MQKTLIKYNEELLKIFNYIENGELVETKELYKIPYSQCHNIIIELLQTVLTIEDNTREFLKEECIVAGLHHPDRHFDWNLPTLKGKLLQLTRSEFFDSPEICDSCAFKNNSHANQSESVANDIDFCLENNKMFYCHKGDKQKPCKGFVRMRKDLNVIK